MTCHGVDELAPAYAVGALDPDEERAVSEHLRTCREPHADTRELIGVGGVLVAVEPPVQPSAGLRDRLMATVAATPQEHVAPGLGSPAPATVPLPIPGSTPPTTLPERVPRGRPWWSPGRPGAFPTAVAAVALAAAVGLGAWGASLNARLAEREEALRAVAAADAAYAVTGSAGSGWVLESGERTIFLAEELATLPAERIYELWLIGPDGVPVAAGTLDDTDGVALVELEAALGSATTFAVTVEAERVDAPTSEPVLVASLEG